MWVKWRAEAEDVDKTLTWYYLSSSPLQNKKANFDATHELEELLLEDNPLKAKKRDEKRDIASLTPDMRQMEEQWVDYHGYEIIGPPELIFLCLPSAFSFLPFDHMKQVRRSYFKHSRRERADRDGDTQSMSQASSAAYTLADQPLAEMGQNGNARGGVGASSATSSLGGVPGLPHSTVPFSGSSGNRATLNDDHEKPFSNNSRNGSIGPSASQEYARAYKAQQQSPRTPSDSGSYPLQVMNEKAH
jgi:serine/threonine kinase 32